MGGSSRDGSAPPVAEAEAAALCAAACGAGGKAAADGGNKPDMGLADACAGRRLAIETDAAPVCAGGSSEARGGGPPIDDDEEAAEPRGSIGATGYTALAGPVDGAGELVGKSPVSPT